MKFTGRSWEEKIDEMRKCMKKKNVDVLVLSQLDDIAWLLNLRGSDIKYNPVFFAYTAITHDRIYFFVNEVQVNDAVIKHLKPTKEVSNIVELRPYEAINGFLSDLKKKTIWLSNHASQALVTLCTQTAAL